MSLTQQDIDFIKTNMAVWLAEQSLDKPPAVYEIELMRQGFEQIDKRFDEMIRRHDRHFLWLIGFITTVSGLVIAAGKLW